MKFVVVSILVLCAVVAIQGSPAKKKTAPKCDIVCTAQYEPVCGANPKDKSVRPRLFSNKCVLDTHNCENKSNLVVVDFDQCKSSGGIRLS